jgi:predicted nucleic acid-binding protein
MPYLAEAVLIDTSAVIALHDNQDQYHRLARTFFDATTDVTWVTLNATAHEAYTRARYSSGFHRALTVYDFLTAEPCYHVTFRQEDEIQARNILQRYSEHDMSFHDALCAAVMKRVGIYRAFTFDRHFLYFGFEVLPYII